MIIFGKSIHRKYHKWIIVFCVFIVCLLFMSCSKIQFDPKTASFRYIFSNSDKWK